MNEFWTAMDSVFALADSGQTDKAADSIRFPIQARQEALSNAVARLLVQNNESEERAAEDTRAIYRRAERNVYVFLAAVLIVVVLTSIYLMAYNRRLFDHVEELSTPAQRAGATTDHHAGEHLPLPLARAARRFRPDSHRYRRHAGARAAPHSRRGRRR